MVIALVTSEHVQHTVDQENFAVKIISVVATNREILTREN